MVRRGRERGSEKEMSFEEKRASGFHWGVGVGREDLDNDQPS